MKVGYYYRFKSTSYLVLVLSTEHAGWTNGVWKKRVFCKTINAHDRTELLVDIDDFEKSYTEYNP